MIFTKVLKILSLHIYGIFISLLCRFSSLFGLSKQLNKIDLSLIQELRHKEIIDYILESKPLKETLILDIGCGRGEILKKLHGNGFLNLFGIDFIPREIDWAIFKHLDVEKLDENTFSDKFDIIILSEVLEHLENPAMALRKASQALKKDGMIIITIPNSMSIWERFNYLITTNFKRYKKEKLNEFGHISVFTEATLSSLCQRASLKVEKNLGGIMFLDGFLFLNGRRVSNNFSYHSFYIFKTQNT